MKTPLKLFVIIAVVAAGTIACALALYSVMQTVHAHYTQADVVRLTDPVPAHDHYMNVRVKIVGVDLDKEKLSLQLECAPAAGSDLYANALHPAKLKDPIYFEIGISRTGTQETKVFSGRYDSGLVDVALDLDGNVEDYPSDWHRTSLWMDAYQDIPGRGTYPVPLRLMAYGAWPGLNVSMHTSPTDYSTARLAENEGITSRQIDFVITRSYVAWTVVAFSIVLTWILIISVIGITVSVVFSRRTSEIGMLAFFGTLLFAMTAFRNSLPGAPAMGTTSDYLAFFWGYGVAIVAIGIVAADWLWKKAKDEEAARAAERVRVATEAAQATAELLAAGALAGSVADAAVGSDAGAARGGDADAAAGEDDDGPDGGGAGG